MYQIVICIIWDGFILQNTLLQEVSNFDRGTGYKASAKLISHPASIQPSVMPGHAIQCSFLPRPALRCAQNLLVGFPCG